MRILFTVFGSRPHLYPLVPLAWAFRAAGHEVRMTSTPVWAADLAYTGLPVITVGGSPRVPAAMRDELATAMFTQEPWPVDWAADVGALGPQRLAYLDLAGRYLAAAAEAMLDELVAFGQDWNPHAVVYDSFSYAGPAAAAALGVPAIRHLSGTDSAQRLELAQPGPGPLPEYAALFERFGVPVRTEPWSAVDPTPPSMRVTAPDGLLNMRYVPYNGPGTEPDGLIGPRSRPRVCVTWGHTISAAVGAEGILPFGQAVDAITALGMDCLVAAPEADLDRLGPWPDSVRALASVPLNVVLPHCDAIVHQGGDGTALTAAVAAIPQLVVTASPEADMCGGRLAATGAGIHLRHPQLRRDPAGPAVIRDAIHALLTEPGHAAAAHGLAAEIARQPAPTEVVATLTNLLDT
ncbi:nucleotide disphospho-sugar-binding domain-containing protein [Actinophytocola sp.]|uniref:nucleotide disphospho-sugar-binding domain-containing protein n=1 Tax=Actinophytocola sp. TaxID=1872138 RepID=UPI002D80626D|nr:nucleotide disphospho-sugar-binding domain-containing protein [Actinophytocola sp.]HET9144268.1 nucleotide disphospho-sugar-binding domain-containing protein [Actinophytocola sp.]